MTLPNFMVIGVRKSGTTSLYSYLSQHPQVFMSPKKEPHFFEFGEEEQVRDEFLASRGSVVLTLKDYQNLFSQVADARAIGEASASNFEERACQRIRYYLPDARFICLLRQPVDRQYSAFWMHRRQGIEPEADFMAVRHAVAQGAALYPYARLDIIRGASWYVERLQDWFARFSRSQFYIGLTDDLQTDAGGFMRDVYTFIDVDERFSPDLSRIHNQGVAFRSLTLRAFLQRDPLLMRLGRRVVPGSLLRKFVQSLQRWNQLAPPPLDPQLRRELTAAQHDDILRLQDIIDRDLTRWLAG